MGLQYSIIQRYLNNFFGFTSFRSDRLQNIDQNGSSNENKSPTSPRKKKGWNKSPSNSFMTRFFSSFNNFWFGINDDAPVSHLTPSTDQKLSKKKKIKSSSKQFLNRLPKLPKRIILVRHGQSLGNVDERVYCSIPDWKVPLTAKGRQQANDAANKIKQIIRDEPVYLICSPYLRTKQTLSQVITKLQSNRIMCVKEEPRMTEQQFGNFQSSEDMKKYKKERADFGRFRSFPQVNNNTDAII
jgi:hypothetical protein